MTYSTKNRAFHRLMQARHDARIDAESRLANALQALDGCCRSDALRRAALIIEREGG